MAPELVETATHAVNHVAQFSNLLAEEADFGGYAGPAGSLLFIAAIITTLAPPLANPEEETTPY
jgi:hypothetical protein